MPNRLRCPSVRAALFCLSTGKSFDDFVASYQTAPQWANKVRQECQEVWETAQAEFKYYKAPPHEDARQRYRREHKYRIALHRRKKKPPVWFRCFGDRW